MFHSVTWTAAIVGAACTVSVPALADHEPRFVIQQLPFMGSDPGAQTESHALNNAR